MCVHFCTRGHALGMILELTLRTVARLGSALKNSKFTLREVIVNNAKKVTLRFATLRSIIIGEFDRMI